MAFEKLSRRGVLRASGTLLGAAAFGWEPKLFADNLALDKVRQGLASAPLQIIKLNSDLTVLSGAGGNVTILTTPSGKLAIDSGVLPASGRLLDAMSGLGSQPLVTLLNTHWHFDHTDGNQAFHKAGATIVAHENVRKRLSSPQHIDFFELDIAPVPSDALPTKEFSEKLSWEQGGYHLHLLHVPHAHTDSDTIIHFPEADVLVSGDILFSKSYPFIDGRSGGSFAGLIHATDQVLRLTGAATKVVPGHGPVMTQSDVREYRNMLTRVHERVSALKKAGKTADQVVAAKPTAEFDSVCAAGMLPPDMFVRVAYATI